MCTHKLVETAVYDYKINPRNRSTVSTHETAVYDIIGNPTSINCGGVSHVTSWREYPKYPRAKGNNHNFRKTPDRMYRKVNLPFNYSVFPNSS
ncbi:hypothetical protein CEXT_459801 [Caerostris extrusa]|uniref:Uncharacterized protein n=1 Tax=Caerostris extrusa TaxID=172846 RepID=A0AAV4UDU1_CAEEX|nr:hypothetical protein CEXT_459801 [Caerostris extrusa]